MSYGQKKQFSRWRSPPSWVPKISIFGHLTAIGFDICCSVPNFIEIGQFFTEIWRFNDFQNGGCPPSWILHICIFCPVAIDSMTFCFVVQNFAEIRQSVDEYWPKKRFSRWRPPSSWISKNSIFDTILACDGRTDGQISWNSILSAIHSIAR